MFTPTLASLLIHFNDIVGRAVALTQRLMPKIHLLKPKGWLFDQSKTDMCKHWLNGGCTKAANSVETEMQNVPAIRSPAELRQTAAASCHLTPTTKSHQMLSWSDSVHPQEGFPGVKSQGLWAGEMFHTCKRSALLWQWLFLVSPKSVTWDQESF